MKIKILGCATSTGVPVVGCGCDVCKSEDPRNKRTRSSAYIEIKNTNILIDSTTDLRLQALRSGITRIDAVLYTHSHADHTHGIDDLRAFNFINDMEISCFANEQTLKNIKSSFGYIFSDTSAFGGIPKLNFTAVSQSFTFSGISIKPIEIMHSKWTIYGYRIGNFAYLTDCSAIPEHSMKDLVDLDLLVLGALRYRQHPAHFNVEQAIECIDQISPKHAVLTHMGHELEYNELASILPPYIEPGFDGLEFEIND